MTSKIKSYTSWQPLEEIIVGRVYTPEYFDFIKDSAVREQMQLLLHETNEDLDNLQKTIEEFGAVVRRPDLPNLDEFLHMQKTFTGVPTPPLTPRDWQITMGEKLLRILDLEELDTIVDDYTNADPSSVISVHKNGYDENHAMAHAVASCIVRVGKDVFFDNSEWMTTEQMNWIRDNVLDERYRVHRAQTNGHGDAVFAILKPGVILSSMHDGDIDYSESFPGWDLCRIRDASIMAAMEIGKFKYENFNGRWYMPGVRPTEEFATFVDTYLNKWTGFVQETVFDVNCLVLDESHVIFSSYNREVFEFCRKHQIEPIICEQRHKYFFDSGISCCTQDIRRRGELESYL